MDSAIEFLKEFKALCDKYVDNASVVTVELKDGRTIGMGVLLRYGLGIISLRDCFSK